MHFDMVINSPLYMYDYAIVIIVDLNIVLICFPSHTVMIIQVCDYAFYHNLSKIPVVITKLSICHNLSKIPCMLILTTPGALQLLALYCGCWSIWLRL